MKQTEIKQTKEHSNNNTPFDLQSKLTIVKRDGSLVTFKPNRIKKAIEAAFRDTKKLEGSLGSAMNNEIHRLTDLVVDQAAHTHAHTHTHTQQGIPAGDRDTQKINNLQYICAIALLASITMATIRSLYSLVHL